MNEQQIHAIVADTRFRDWQFHVGPMGDGFFLQIRFVAPDAETGALEVQHGRKWYLSRFAIADEIVKTTWLAVMTALEHEAREAFRYQDEAVFGPHTDVGALVELQRTHQPVGRPERTAASTPGGIA